MLRLLRLVLGGLWKVVGLDRCRPRSLLLGSWHRGRFCVLRILLVPRGLHRGRRWRLFWCRCTGWRVLVLRVSVLCHRVCRIWCFRLGLGVVVRARQCRCRVILCWHSLSWIGGVGIGGWRRGDRRRVSVSIPRNRSRWRIDAGGHSSTTAIGAFSVPLRLCIRRSSRRLHFGGRLSVVEVFDAHLPIRSRSWRSGH